MQKFYHQVIKHRKIILILFLFLFAVCAVCQPMVSVNYDMNSYLPTDSDSTIALDVMAEEFEGGIPNARVMIYDVSLAEALDYKEKLSCITGVSDVTWLDDAIDVKEPLQMQDQDTIETYYKDGNALFTVTIEEDYILSAVSLIRNLIGPDNAMTGSAVSTAIATESTVSEISRIAVFAVLFVLFVLALTTTSWLEPLIVLGGLGVAIVINAGSNLIFGEISFVTNAAGNILQLAVSLDYSVFLIHRFEECLLNHEDPKAAMEEALCKSTSSILSSGLTTVIGFLALALMRFRIGPDLGLALAKGIAISLLTVFLFMPGLILATHKWMEKTRHRYFLPDFKRFGKLISIFMVPFACIFLVICVPAYLGSTSNSYYYGSSHIFSEGTQLGDDTKAIEAAFGKSDTYVLLVPKGDTATEYALVTELKSLPQVSSVIAFVEQAGPEIPYEYLDEETLKMLESENYSRIVLSVKADFEGDETTALIEQLYEITEKYYSHSCYLAGEGISTYDLMNTVTEDMTKVNLIAIGAVLVVLLLTMRCISLPVILVLTIETAIWVNLSYSYFKGNTVFYIAYLIISSIQLGATVDYAILFTDRYRENRVSLDKKEAIIETVSNVTASILTSGITLTVVGFLLGIISTHGLLSQLGFLLGKGTICSLVAVLFVLPGFLYLTDGLINKRKHNKNRRNQGGLNNEAKTTI